MARYNCGLAHQNLGDVDRAIADYTKAAEMDPTDPAPFVNRGLLRAGRKEYDAAIEDYDRALKARPGFSLAHFNKGQAFELTGRLPEAIAAYRAAVKSLGPEHRAEAQRLLAELERRLPQ